MVSTHISLSLILLCLLGSALSAGSCRGYDCMKNYIDKPEPAYKWSDTGVRLREEEWTGYLLNFTSQTWLTPELVTREGATKLS